MNLSHDYYFARKISSVWFSWKGNFNKWSIALYDEEETIHLLNPTIYYISASISYHWNEQNLWLLILSLFTALPIITNSSAHSGQNSFPKELQYSLVWLKAQF